MPDLVRTARTGRSATTVRCTRQLARHDAAGRPDLSRAKATTRSRGGDGNDRIEGGAGNDNHDRRLPATTSSPTTFGDDVMKGGPGNDAIAGGAGPFDLLQGNEGNDFIVAGQRSVGSLRRPGQRHHLHGQGPERSRSAAPATTGWRAPTRRPASLIGDENNQFQNDPNRRPRRRSSPVLGDMDFDIEGGDDIMVGNVIPTHRFEGMLGFDWATYRGETIPVDADMLVTGAIAVNAPLNENRDRLRPARGSVGHELQRPAARRRSRRGRSA